MWLREVFAVYGRDMRGELRTRVALSGTLLFTVSSLALIALAMRGNTAAESGENVAALLWVVLFFAASVGLARTFVQEEERGTSLALRLTARASAVWAGKCLTNVTVLFVLMLLATPLLLGILERTPKNTSILVCVLTAGAIGIAAVFTTTGALVAQANANSGLLAALSFPLLMPLLLAGLHGTKVALGVAGEANWSMVAGDIQVLAAFAVVSIAASLMTFEFIWND